MFIWSEMCLCLCIIQNTVFVFVFLFVFVLVIAFVFILVFVFLLDRAKYADEIVPVHVVGDVSRRARLESEVAPVRQH